MPPFQVKVNWSIHFLLKCDRLEGSTRIQASNKCNFLVFYIDYKICAVVCGVNEKKQKLLKTDVKQLFFGLINTYFLHMAVSPSSSSSSWSTLLETGSGIALLPEVEFETTVDDVGGNKPTVVAIKRKILLE